MIRLTLNQEMKLSHELRIELTGGWTTTVFPKVEEWLNADSDRWRALQYIGSHALMDRYRSVVDYLYAQMSPELRREVFRYYLSGDDRDKAVNRLTLPERNYLQAMMLVACEVAYQLWREKRRASWKTVRSIVAEIAA